MSTPASSGFSAVKEGGQNLLIVIGWVAVSGVVGALLLARRDAQGASG